ncbi:MAG TPA: phospholipase [Burkholderiaceae bacterium]|nr:phospholipase [Burkholderiaceae bacterium]
MQALSVHAGARAMRALRRHGLQAEHVRAIPAAAGGPKGLALNPLDQYLFGEWLAPATRPIHLLGASIGAWRMAAACLDDPARALARMADDYIQQRYDHAPGKPPSSAHVSEVFGANLIERFHARSAELLHNRRFRLHVFTSRGRRLLRRHGRALSSLSTPLGHAGAFAANALHRRAMGGWWERVVFSDPREPLPIPLHDYRTRTAVLSDANLAPSILASCSIPYWLDPVRDIAGAPPGVYWDGGITDYQLHLDYAAMLDASDDAPSLVLYPHFQARIVPGWLDKYLTHRHRATARLSNVIVVSPSPQWIASLPGGKLPDRADFKRFGDDTRGRVANWTHAVRESERLRDEFAAWAGGGVGPTVQPLV